MARPEGAVAAAIGLLIVTAVAAAAQPGRWVRPGARFLAASPAWERPGADRRAALEAVLGPGWLVTRHAAFKTPRWLIGPGYETGISPLTAAAAVSMSRRLAGRLAGALGLDDPAGLRLERTAATASPSGHTILGVDFVQTVAGFEVRTLAGPCCIKFRYDATLGRLAALGSDCVPGLRTVAPPGLDRPAAEVLALDLVPRFAPGTGRVLRFRTYVLVGRENERGPVEGRLVHDLLVQTRSPPHLWHVILAATTGDPLYVADELAHGDVTGNVSGGTLDGPGGKPPAVPFSVVPLRDLYVYLKGGSRTATNILGNFRVPIPSPAPSPLVVVGRLDGQWCSVQNQVGPNLGFATLVPASRTVKVVLNGTYLDEFRTAETTAYRWVTHTRHRLARYLPGFNALKGLTANVNLANVCNAFFNGSSLNFFAAGGQCVNTAFADIIVHEYGHAFHLWFHQSLNPPYFSEGIGDHLSMYVTGQYQVGRNLRGQGGALRDYRDGQPACCTRWPPKNRSFHEDGQIWGGFTKDLRQNLMARHGNLAGAKLAELLTIAQYSRNPTDMPDAVFETFVQDDDDANLRNGTPNFAEIARAADAHNLPRPPDPDPVLISHLPLPDSGDVVNGYPVVAKVTASRAPLKSVVLAYRTGTGPFVNLTMRPGPGGRHAAIIPPQPAVTVVRYKITATDTLNNVAVSPPQGEHLFVVGRVFALFRDSFELDRGWRWARDDTATQGRFERADPIFAAKGTEISQPENDHTPAPGRLCYVTQNGQRGQDPAVHDVDAGRTSIVSPAVDLSAQTPDAVRVRYGYWFTDYTATDDRLVLAVSPDDGKTFKDAWSESTSAAGWREARVVVPGPYTSRMRLRFRVADNPNNSVCDALVDDVIVEGADDNVAVLRAPTRTPARGSTLAYTLVAARMPRAVYIFSLAFTPGPTVIPGVGTSGLGLPLFPIFIGPLDSQGAARFGLPIANHPALAGLQVYSEAFVGGANRTFLFSNRWDFVIQ